MSKKIKIVTHDGNFHADDVFGVATLLLLLGEENCEVIRSRNPEIISEGDYVLDVGRIYDPNTNRFDHHQKEGAGEHPNGIPYASFGISWNKFGESVCGSLSVAEAIDKALVQPIDAVDTGFDFEKQKFEGIRSFSVGDIVRQYVPTWKENVDTLDDHFMSAVLFAKGVLLREIEKVSAGVEAEKSVEETYKNTSDKRLIIFEENQAFGRSLISSVLVKFPEPLYAVFFSRLVGRWGVVAINKDENTFKTRKPFPAVWRGKDKEELVEASGIKDADFCHRAGFLCGVGSKEGAIELAKLALEA